MDLMPIFFFPIPGFSAIIKPTSKEKGGKSSARNQWAGRGFAMAQRSVAEYQGTYIGIESVFTVIDGKQINIPGVAGQRGGTPHH